MADYTSLTLSVEEVVALLLQERGVPSSCVGHVALQLGEATLLLGRKGTPPQGTLTISHLKVYPVLCMDCEQPTGQMTACRGSTGLCETHVDERNAVARERHSYLQGT